MSKKRYRPEEIIRLQQGESVCAGFAFPCHFLSSPVTSCPLEGGPNRLNWISFISSLCTGNAVAMPPSFSLPRRACRNEP